MRRLQFGDLPIVFFIVSRSFADSLGSYQGAFEEFDLKDIDSLSSYLGTLEDILI